MAQTNINVRMDEDLKKQFDTFCTAVGMNMSTAINIFARTVVREQRIPFEIELGTQTLPDEDVMTLSQKLITQNREAYEVLVK